MCPLIKPKHNSFVFDADTDPAICLYLDPASSKEAFGNTVSHELHHIGLSSTDKIYAATIASLSAGPKMAAEARKARAGHVTGGRVFGYRNVPVVDAAGQKSHVRRVNDETEAAVVRRAFQ